MTSYFHIANRLSLCLIFTACCVIAHSAVAEEDVGRWYGSLGLGWNYAKPIEIDDTGGVIDYDFGLPAASFALGFRPVEKWRVELEVSHQENKPEILYFPGSDVEIDTVQSDALKTTSFMMSAIRDFNLGIAFRPYLGIGAGTANIRSKFTAGDSAGEEIPIIDDETWAFAYQGMVGLTVPVSRSLTLAMEYRYWQAPSPDLEDLAGNAVDGRQTIHSGWFRLNYQPGGYAWNPETVARHPRGICSVDRGNWTPFRSVPWHRPPWVTGSAVAGGWNSKVPDAGMTCRSSILSMTKAGRRAMSGQTAWPSTRCTDSDRMPPSTRSSALVPGSPACATTWTWPPMEATSSVTRIPPTCFRYCSDSMWR
jgi:opacity protein-like surface antigen